MESTLRHHFTVDVEESFQVSAMAPYVSRAEWDTLPSRVSMGVALLLALLETNNAVGTFFVLGWIAQKHPALVRQIAAAGHEVASHGWGHEKVTDLSPEAFRDSIRNSKALLESITGAEVNGYRAPSFSIIRGGEWALDILLEEGYAYDSSLYPVRRSGYGYANGGRDPYVLRRASGLLQEFPPATRQVGRVVLAAGGGAYFRHLPYWLVSSAFADAEDRGVPATFYIHPWELDVEQPRIAVPFTTRLRHYGGLARTRPRLQRLLSCFRFQSIATTLRRAQFSDDGVGALPGTR